MLIQWTSLLCPFMMCLVILVFQWIEWISGSSVRDLCNVSQRGRVSNLFTIQCGVKGCKMAEIWINIYPTGKLFFEVKKWKSKCYFWQKEKVWNFYYGLRGIFVFPVFMLGFTSNNRHFFFLSFFLFFGLYFVFFFN